MFTTFFTFLKTKLFSLPVVFIGILVAIISIFLIYNSDTVLSRFGFETKTVLKAQVESLKKDLKQAESVNADLLKKLEYVEQQAKIREQALVEYYQNVNTVQKRVSSIQKTKIEKEKVIQEEIKQQQVLDENTKTVSFPIEKLNEHSSIQISTLNEVYHELFENS